MIVKGDIVVDTAGHAFAVEGVVVDALDQNRILVYYPTGVSERDHRDLTIVSKHMQKQDVVDMLKRIKVADLSNSGFSATMLANAFLKEME